MIENAKVQEAIYLKEIERLLSRRPDIVKTKLIKAELYKQYALLNSLRVYKDIDESGR